jgi:septal ring factor EnvC (AmiA/AmiB activator)
MRAALFVSLAVLGLTACRTTPPLWLQERRAANTELIRERAVLLRTLTESLQAAQARGDAAEVRRLQGLATGAAQEAAQAEAAMAAQDAAEAAQNAAAAAAVQNAAAASQQSRPSGPMICRPDAAGNLICN